MLNKLIIQNYALIKNLSINFSDNFNIITGETGAGKSIMLGAVGLLLGNRSDGKIILNNQYKCIIEGHFEIHNVQIKNIFEKQSLDFESTTIIRREITTAGKSRAFINDTPVTLDTLKKIGLRLIDVHSQHETLQLSKNSFQLKFVDVFSGTLNLRAEYYKVYTQYQKKNELLKELKEKNKTINQESDYNNHLFEELTNANIQIGEQSELEKSLKIIENAENIKIKLNEGIHLLNNENSSIIDGIRQLKVFLENIQNYDNKYTNLSKRVENIFLELNDINLELESEEDKINFNEEEANMKQDRLTLIYQLQKKHSVLDEEGLIRIREQIEEKVSNESSINEQIDNLKKETDILLKKCNELALQLTHARVNSFKDLSSEIKSLLSELGMVFANIEFTRKEINLSNTGADEIKILFSANKGVPLQELSTVASGGEFSRLMFCLKYILTKKIALPTVIFDEIDTGIGGEIAIKLGKLMKKMADNHQIIVISHLPHIAAKGDKHYLVYKDTETNQSETKVKELMKDERVFELAKMLGGDSPSLIAYENAKELMRT